MKPPQPSLERSVALPGAVLLGLGSMLGSGAYVAIALAIPLAGAHWLLAVIAAGVLALLNGLSSARLATAFPKSGGAYEYGYRLLHPSVGFTAGWAFLLAKSASAATAALALVALVRASPAFVAGAISAPALQITAPLIVLIVTVLAATGLRRSNVANAILVGLALAGLSVVLITALGSPSPLAAKTPIGDSDKFAPLQAIALLFVAFTGYGRVATMGEEIRDPGRNIPRAVIATILATTLLYVAVAAAANRGVNAATLQLDGWPAYLLLIGGAAALLGVLLNLILGLSRVALAMARRGDLPATFATINKADNSPTHAVWLVGLIILILAATSSIKAAWSFSAFTVLIYYGILNLCALRLAFQQKKAYLVPIFGLLGCLSLAAFVEARTWMLGTALLAAGLVVHLIAQRITRASGAGSAI